MKERTNSFHELCDLQCHTDLVCRVPIIHQLNKLFKRQRQVDSEQILNYFLIMQNFWVAEKTILLPFNLNAAAYFFNFY